MPVSFRYVADGVVQTEYITVESEYSAMSACIGASCRRRARHDGYLLSRACAHVGMLYVASGMRLPIVMTK